MHDLRTLAVAGKLAQNAEPTPMGFSADQLPGGEYLMEAKYDGWRCLAVVGEESVELFARSGNQFVNQLPAIQNEILGNFPAGTVLDGEAVALAIQPDGTVINEWGTAQSVITTLGGEAASDKITFMVFDLLAHGELDARPLALADRRVLLERIFDGRDFECIALSDIVEATDAGYKALVEAGMEGAVVKRLDAPYRSGKREGAGWKKMKATFRCEGVVMGFKDGKNGFAGMVGALIFGQYDPATGTLVERGSCSGFDGKTRADITANPDKWLGRVIEFAHNGVDIGKSQTGRFRHPQFKRVRDDRTAESVEFHNA